PTPIDYVIPANDDAAKSISHIMDVLCAAINEGLNERKLEKEKEAPEQNDAQAGKKLRSRKGGKPAEAAAEEAPKAEAAVEAKAE
ncbi:MAG: 30S ribosomal protein S2, partial [Bacteroidales bacterium]|nr:30S ribosomal protein S2 [Bacteroidales bacterium]